MEFKDLYWLDIFQLGAGITNTDIYVKCMGSRSAQESWAVINLNVGSGTNIPSYTSVKKLGNLSEILAKACK